MASPISANKAELLAIATSVATEKMIDKAIVIEAMEEAIQKAARSRYGAENDIRAKLDPMTGDLRLWRVVEVVEEVEDYFKQVDIKQAEKLQPGATVGDFIVDPLPPVDLGRIDAQSAKQVIFQKVRDADRSRACGRHLAAGAAGPGSPQRGGQNTGLLLGGGKGAGRGLRGSKSGRVAAWYTTAAITAAACMRSPGCTWSTTSRSE
jgi:hypothetical protein